MEGLSNTQTNRTGAPVFPHAAAAAAGGSLPVQADSSICHILCRRLRKSCKYFSNLFLPAAPYQPLRPPPFSYFFFFFLRWQLIRRLRPSASSSQRTARNWQLRKSNASLRLTLRPHQSQELVIFLHPGRPVHIHLPQRQVKCGSVNKLATLR